MQLYQLFDLVDYTFKLHVLTGHLSPSHSHTCGMVNNKLQDTLSLRELVSLYNNVFDRMYTQTYGMVQIK